MAKGFDNQTIECIDITRHLNFCVGNAVKCIWEAGKKKDYKKGIEDCKEALRYLNDDGINIEQPDKVAAWAIFELLTPPPVENDIESSIFYIIRKIIKGYYYDATMNTTALMRVFKGKVKSKKKRVGIDKGVKVNNLLVGDEVIYKGEKCSIYAHGDEEVALCKHNGELIYVKPNTKVTINKENK